MQFHVNVLITVALIVIVTNGYRHYFSTSKMPCFGIISLLFLLLRLIAPLHNAQGNLIDTDRKCVFASGKVLGFNSQLTNAEGR